jgi:DNA polymerase (family X)
MPDKKEVVNILEEIAGMMDFKGENRFKINAYRNAANSIKRISEDFNSIVEEKRLGEIRGIGKGLQSLIYEFYQKGFSPLYEELKKEVPDGIEELLKIKGLSARKINILYTELGISSIGELEYACTENRLAMLKGFGEDVQQKILKEIENYKLNSRFVLLNTAGQFAADILDKLKSFKSILHLEISGDLRRGMEIISSIEIIVLLKDKKKFLLELKNIFEIEGKNSLIAVHSYFLIPVNLHLCFSPEEFTLKQFLITGSESFIKEINYQRDGRFFSEEEIFISAGAPYVIPEMREHQYFEIKNDHLKRNSLLKLDDFKGLLHFHSNYSDGRNTLEEMLRAAEDKGFSFAAVCDHSKSAYYANGLKEDAILRQKEELKELSSKLNITLFHGIESDILKDGSLDYDPEFLKQFDFVVASIHSRFKMDDMTERMLRAIENPHTDLLAHPSGRLLLSREPYNYNVTKIIDACSANKVAIEINCNPRRLDIDWRSIYYAREKGCLFSINPDAHSIAEIDLIKYGIIMGKKGGLQPEEVINCFTAENFKKFLVRKIKRKFSI